MPKKKDALGMIEKGDEIEMKEITINGKEDSIDMTEDEDWETEEGPIRTVGNEDLEKKEEPFYIIEDEDLVREKVPIREFNWTEESETDNDNVDVFIEAESGEGSSLTISN